MKIKGPFVKVVLLNQGDKHPLFKSNLDIGRFCDSFYIFQYPYYSISKLFTINIPLKWHHIGICNKNCQKIDVLTRILTRFHSFVSSFEHVNFAINAKYSNNFYNNPNYYVRFVIFQTYKNVVLKSVHSLG